MANSDNQRGGSGNFAQDRDRASDAGRKGGEHGGQRQQSQTSGGQRQMGGGTAAQNPGRASEPGREGGRHTQEEKRSPDRDHASDAGSKGGQR